MPDEVVMPHTQAGPGFFGKLPCNGDFVTRRLLRQPFLDKWDDWLQHSIAISREQLQDSWLSIYLTSPIWRFTLSSGLCGDSVWTGLLMPSVDKVGRYFPLTIAVELDSTSQPLLLAGMANDWFDKAEEAALSALEDDIDLDQFDQRIEHLGRPDPGSYEATSHPVISPSTPLQMDIPSVSTVAQTYPDLVKLLFDSTYTHYSLWWTSGSDHVNSRLIVHPGLPSKPGFTAFLDGNWVKWGWPQPPNHQTL